MPLMGVNVLIVSKPLWVKVHVVTAMETAKNSPNTLVKKKQVTLEVLVFSVLRTQNCAAAGLERAVRVLPVEQQLVPVLRPAFLWVGCFPLLLVFRQGPAVETSH